MTLDNILEENSFFEWGVTGTCLSENQSRCLFLRFGIETLANKRDFIINNKGQDLHILRGLWEYDFAPEITLYKE